MNRICIATSISMLCAKAAAEICSQGESVCGPGCFLNNKNLLCESVPAGYYSPFGDNELFECRVGHFSRGHAEACTPCAPGRFADTKGSDTCYLCGIATYSSEIGSKGCESCNPALFVGYGSEQIETHSGITFCLEPPKIRAPTGFPSVGPSLEPSISFYPTTLYPSGILTGSPTGAPSTLSPSLANTDPNGLTDMPTQGPTTTGSFSEAPAITSNATGSTGPTLSPISLAPTPGGSMEPTTFNTNNQSLAPNATPSQVPARSNATDQIATNEPSNRPTCAPCTPPTETPTQAPSANNDDSSSSVPLMQKLLLMVALPLFILSVLICCCVWILLGCCIKKEKTIREEPVIVDEVVSEIEDSEVYLETDTQVIDGMSEVDVDDGGSVEVWANF